MPSHIYISCDVHALLSLGIFGDVPYICARWFLFVGFSAFRIRAEAHVLPNRGVEGLFAILTCVFLALFLFFLSRMGFATAVRGAFERDFNKLPRPFSARSSSAGISERRSVSLDISVFPTP